MRILVPFLALAALAACAAPPQVAPEVSETSRKIDSSLVDAARTAEQRGDFQTAGSYYRGIYERDQGNLEAVLGLARSLRQMDRAKEARALLERSIAQRPQEPRLLAELGKAQLGADAALDAIESLSKADALRPGDWEVNSALGVAYDRQGMYEQAERRYRQALQLSPDNVSVLNNLGLSLAQSGRLAQGVEALERAVSLPEATPQVRQNLALLYAMKGDLRATERLVRRDLTGELAEQNLAYYRRLSASLKAGEPTPLPAPLLGAAPSPVAPATAALAPQGIPAPQPPVTVAAAAPSAERKVPPPTSKAPPADEKAPEAERKAPAAEDRVAPAEERAAPARQRPSLPESTVAPPPATPRSEPPRSEASPPAAPVVAAARPESDEPDSARPAEEKPAAIVATAASSAAEPAAARPGSFRLQLGSFPTPEIADLGAGQIRKRHGDVLGEAKLEVVKASVPEKGEVYRIVTAPPSDADAARALCEALKGQGGDCLLVRLPLP